MSSNCVEQQLCCMAAWLQRLLLRAVIPFQRWPAQQAKLCISSRAQRKYSVAKIDTSTTYEKGRPKSGGLSDLRMGTMDRAFKCATDGANVQDCPGYFGHIELAKPMFHVGFITTVIKVLRCVSYHCSKILVEKARPWARLL